MLPQQYQLVLFVFTALRLLMVFEQQHCQIGYQDMVLFQWKEGYQRHLAVALLKHFELHFFHI
jgi:hypothetical protein